MTPAELFRPRYKLVADYPGNLCPVGHVFTRYNDTSDGGCRLPDLQMGKYPHLFKRLLWWQDRPADEMPDFIKPTDYALGDRFYSVMKGPFKIDCGWIIVIDGGDADRASNWLPATADEYADYAASYQP